MSIKSPTARMERLVVEEVGEEVLVYDLDSHKAHCLNRSAALVWRGCDGRTSVDELAQRLHRELGVPADPELAHLAIDYLREAGLLHPDAPVGRKISRRRVASCVALAQGLAVLAPAVVSILAPTAAAAATLLPNGEFCASAPDCASNCCCSATFRCEAPGTCESLEGQCGLPA